MKLSIYRGFHNLKIKNYSGAVQEFQQNLLGRKITKEQNYLIHFGLGRAFEGLKDEERALRHYFDAVQLLPSLAAPFYPLVRLLKKRYRNTGQVFALLAGEHDFEVNSHKTLKARLAFKLGEFSLTLLFLSEVGVTDQSVQTSPDLKLLYSRSLLGAGKYDLALKCYQGLKSLEEMEKNNQIKAEYLLTRWLAAGVGSDKEVLFREEAQKLSPEWSGEFKLLLLERCLFYRAPGLFEKLLESFERQKIDWESRLLIGELYYCSGYYDKAYQELVEVVEQGEGDAVTYYYLGELLERKGRIEEAEGYYCQALAVDSQEIKFKLAAARTALKRLKQITEQILKIIPEQEVFAHKLLVIDNCLRRL